MWSRNCLSILNEIKSQLVQNRVLRGFSLALLRVTLISVISRKVHTSSLNVSTHITCGSRVISIKWPVRFSPLHHSIAVAILKVTIYIDISNPYLQQVYLLLNNFKQSFETSDSNGQMTLAFIKHKLFLGTVKFTHTYL